MNVLDLFERIPMPIKRRMPALLGSTDWLNSQPLTSDDLRGKVVVVDFWTYTCINWIRTLPYVRAWAAAYGPYGLVVIGVHTPEFAIERDVDNVRRAASNLRVDYPVAIDNDYAVWKAFANQFWPALYVADSEGRIRHQHFGEGGYERAEQMIRRLLLDAGAADLPNDHVQVTATGLELAADTPNVRSRETYVGSARAFGFANPGGASDQGRPYALPPRLRINEWAVAGNWTLHSDRARLNQPGGVIAYRFHARDLNLVLAPTAGGAPVRFRVRLDGQPPNDAHGLDTDGPGNGTIRESRLYQLIRQASPIEDRLFEIEFLDADGSAFCFTFG